MPNHTTPDSVDDSETHKQNSIPVTDGGTEHGSVDEGQPLTAVGFFEALSEGRLVGGRCRDCDAVLLPPRPICNECGRRDVVAEDLPKAGTIVTHTNIYKTAPVFDDLAPLPVAIVELDSTGRLPGRVDAPYEEISIGDRVCVEIREPTDSDRSFALDHEKDWPLHVFSPVDSEQ